MSEILERLRRLHGLREQKPHDPARPPASASPAQADEEQVSARPRGLPDDDPDLWDAPRARATGPQPLQTAVPGAVLETEAGTCYVSTYAYPLANPRGDFPLGALLDQPPRLLDQLHAVGVQAGERAGRAFDYSQAAFIDTETSGLGTGSCCFMVGVGAFEALPPLTASGLTRTEPRRDEDGEPIALHENSALYWEAAPPLSSPHAATHFVVRQFFMRNPGEETALLAALATTLTQYSMTVTFNGRAFDLPLLRSRFRLHRHFLPASIPLPDLLDERNVHVDLLPPARRLWKRRLQSCRLINLEQKILNLHRSEDDVPGQLIPMLYVNFTRNGDARAMRQVFYHNREDIVSMVGIATHLATTITSTHSTSGNASGNASGTASRPSSTSPTPHAADATGNAGPPLHGHEWLAMGQHYAKQGQPHEAIAALQQATQTLSNAIDRALAFSELAGIYKRGQDWTQACATWQLWISSVPGHDPTPYLELAKYCEWQSRELNQAEMWCAWALHNLQQADPRSHHRANLGEIEHRLARIRRKRAAQSPPATNS